MEFTTENKNLKDNLNKSVFHEQRWMLQFIPGHREDIVCRRDGTLRYSEPSGNENLACIVPFILIYYFLIAANVWFAIFTYAWFLQTKDRGMFDRIESMWIDKSPK